ncbi:hypothetical protein M8J76_000949 [Diaphorina citri]|nr:hypothetical protein M8J76_000949 [Diaphorina citri]
MISSYESDLMGWNSPSNNSTAPKSNGNLHEPLLPTINVQSPCTINNPFDAVCDKINSEIQNPFDDICSLVMMQTQKQSKREENEMNLLNMTMICNSKEDLQNKSPNTSTLSENDILNVSSLDDNLLNISKEENMIEEMGLMNINGEKKMDNNNFLSQSQCDYSQANTSTTTPTSPCFQELCSKLENSFNESKSMYEKEEKILTAFKRRSAEFFSKHEREEEQQAQQAMSTPARVCSKTALKPLDSPSIRLRTNSKVLATNTRSTTGVKPRQGPMKAVAPLKSMIKSSNVLPGKLDLGESKGQAKPSAMYKSSYHKSPIKQLVLRSKSTSSVPPLASSTPEKLVHHSFTSTSPIHTSNTIKPSSSSPQSNLTAGVKPRKHIFTSPLKTGPSPLKTGPSPLKSTSSNIGGGIPRNHSFSSSSPLKTGPSPLKTTSANVEGAKQRSSSLSRLRPPSAVGSKPVLDLASLSFSTLRM